MNVFTTSLAGPSTSRRTLAVLSSTLTHRSFHSSPSTLSHIGSTPLPIPSTVTLIIPPPALRRSVTITGPLGSTSVPIPSAVTLSPPTESNPILSVAVQAASQKDQKALWGLTRALLGNAVFGVSEGYKLGIRLVGVGYRAAVEPIPPSLQFEAPKTLNTSSASQRSSSTSLSTHRLNLKLGYAHPILIPIPPHITVTTPQPTRIILSGIDKQKLGLFAAMIRRYRKPEPYRGKVSVRRRWLNVSHG